MSSSYKIRKRTRIDNSTSATTLTDGALVVDGGVSSGGNIILGGYIGLRAANTNTVSIIESSTTDTYNFNLPTSVGASGDVLTSQGGGSSAMTWSTCTGTSNIVRSNGPTFGASIVTFGGQIQSTVANGTAPFIVGSNTNVVNLNASSLNGATFASPGSIGSSTASSGAFTTISSTTTTGNTLVVSSTSSDVSSITGNSISTLGGIGVTGQSFFSNSTGSSSITTGAIVVTGGIGVGGNSTFGGNVSLTSAGFLILSNTGSSTSLLSSNSFSTVGGIGVGGQSFFSNSTASTNNSTGAIVVNGGIGVGGNSTFSGNVGIGHYARCTLWTITTSTTLTLTTVTSNVFTIGMTISGTGITGAPTITSITSGTGSSGTVVVLSSAQTNITGSTNTIIGTNAPQSSLHVAGIINTSPTNAGIHMGIDSNGYSSIQLNSNLSGTSGSLIDFSFSGSDNRGRIIYDNSSNLFQFQNNLGRCAFSATHTSSDTTPAYNFSTATTNPRMLAFFSSPLGNGNTTYLAVGKTLSAYNSGFLQYNHVSDGSTSNNIGLSMYNSASSIVINGLGNVGIGTASPQSSLHVAGSTVSAPTGAGVHMGIVSGYTVIQLNSAAATNTTGSFIDFSFSGLDNKSRIVYDNASSTLNFENGGTVALTINKAGTVTSAPLYNFACSISNGLHVNGSQLQTDNFRYGAIQVTLNDTDTNDGNGTCHLSLIRTGSNVVRHFINSSQQYVIINVSNGLYLAINGTSWTAVSDRRKKTDFSPFIGPLDRLCQINGMYYRYLTDNVGVRRPGIIAQDVQSVLPEAVTLDNEGFLGVSYTEIIPLAIEAIKELKTQVETLKQRIEALEALH